MNAAYYRPISLLTSFYKVFEKTLTLDLLYTFILLRYWLSNNIDLGKFRNRRRYL
jgi:hypothetical protein